MISVLGKKVTYVETYSPDLLFPVERAMARNGLTQLPFHGDDLWTGFELSWLNPKGKPEIAIASFSFPCTTPYLIESKSFKLYLNSFNQSHFESFKHVEDTLKKDLSQAAQGDVSVNLYSIDHYHAIQISPPGYCLDHLDVKISNYECDKSLLQTSNNRVTEKLYSHLLKSNCLATGQPDWGTFFIHYEGNQIDHEALLKYIISFRRHSGFAEHCAEQIFCDLLSQCHPDKLTVYLRYTRRGGLDINPFRSNFERTPSNLRLIRQ